MTDRARLCILGSINMDLTVRAPRLPAPGETMLGGTIGRSPGGKGANQAVAAARIGASVAFIGAVGDDADGKAMLAALAADGIDTGRIQVRAGTPTGAAFITVDDRGENTIIVAPGANTSLTVADVDAARPVIAEADVLLMQLESPLEAVTRAAEIGKDLGATVMLNAAPACKLPASLLSLLDVLIVNEVEALAIGGGPPAATYDVDPVTGASQAAPLDDFESLLDRLLRLGAPTVVITAGADGAHWAHTREHRGHIPACPAQPVDTVGAGDAFCGVFAARLAEHKIGCGIDRDGVFDAVCWANAAGSLATLKAGAIPSLPRRDEVVRLLREAGP